MIIDNQKSGILEIYGEHNAKKATINSDKIAKLQYILTEGLYSDPVGATIVEITNNAMDSMIEAGKLDEPVTVSFVKENWNSYRMIIEDRGIGMDREFFENVFMSMLSSTKEDSEDAIGHFGIGGKSWASLKKTVTFTIIKDGVKCKYLCYKGEEFIDYNLLLEEQTDEENGVIFELPMGYSEYNDFVNKAKKKLSYYDNVALIIEGNIWQNTICRDGLFQWCNNMPYSQMHLCLRDVIYEIDWNKLGIPPINIPIALRFGLGDGIIPTPSRENILYSSTTIELIKSRIGVVATKLVNEFNKKVEGFDNITQAWHLLNVTDKTMKLEDDNMNAITFSLSGIVKYASTTINPIRVKGISLKHPDYYKQVEWELGERFINCAEIYNGTWKTKRIYATAMGRINNASVKVVRVKSTPVGNIKEFLKEKYRHALIIVDGGPNSLKRYRQTCLRGIDRVNWRAHIKEYQLVQEQILDSFIDERNLAETKQYEEWLEEHRKWLKSQREKKQYIGKTLGKEEGDVTLGWYRKPSVNRKGIISVVEKEAVAIDDIKKFPHMIVYTTEDNPEIQALSMVMKRVKFCLIGPRELRKLPIMQGKILKFEEFMEGNTKPFSRWATSLLFKRAITDFKKLGAEDIIKLCLDKFQADMTKLEAYVSQNVTSFSSDEALNDAILAVAEKGNLFDKSLWDSYQNVIENTKKYEFLRVFQKPSVFDGANSKDRYKRVINQMLLFRKKYYNDFEEYDFLIQKKADTITV